MADLVKKIILQSYIAVYAINKTNAYLISKPNFSLKILLKMSICNIEDVCTVWSSELDTLLMRYEVNFNPYRIKSVSNSLDQTVVWTGSVFLRKVFTFLKYSQKDLKCHFKSSSWCIHSLLGIFVLYFTL